MNNRKISIPLYDIGTLICGFYIGYHEGKGIDTSQTIEYLTKYGPTSLAVLSTPLTIKASNMFGRWINKKIMRNLESENLEIIMKNKTTKRYKNLNEDEKKEMRSKILKSIDTLEYRLENQKYIIPTLKIGTRTAIESIIGYTAGRIHSQIN